MMSAIAFSPPASRIYPLMAGHYAYALPSASQASMADRRMSSANENATMATTVLMRKLPRNTSLEALKAMLLFAKDLKDAEIIPNEFDEDQGFSTAIARFSTVTGAMEAQAMLDGKPNTAGQANMIVEVLNGPGMAATGRRNTIDPTATRTPLHPVSPPNTMSAVPQKSSRFNGTFQSIEKSPPMIGSPPLPEHSSSSEGSSHLQTIFSSQSPQLSSVQERSRVSGKSVIGQDSTDDDTGELLKDPVAYMKNDISMPSLSRRPTNPQMPISRFASLSLNTNMASPSGGNYASPRSAMYTHTPTSALSPTMGPNAGHQMSKQHYLRHNYPPVNPADQNPPCNTLYVGNLPIDTSEDELKAMFSKQRGYKRLCFRTKQNGPMCFVEFEDISFATKALNELYGVQLHNSVKGGIRLSFSKNPLGVRAGQPGSTNPSTPLMAAGPLSMNGLGTMSAGAFSTANGPPPGLSVPPGLGMSMSMSNPMSPSMLNGQFSSQGLGIHNPRGVPLGVSMGGTSAGPPMGGMYPDYMMGR